MKRILVALTMVAAATATTAGTRPVSASPPAHSVNACTVTGYTSNCTGCARVPARGSFTLHVSRSSVAFRGAAAAGTAGTQICVARVAAPVHSMGGMGVRVTATGRFAPLHPTKGKLYRYNPKNKKDARVSSIDRAGIYQIV